MIKTAERYLVPSLKQIIKLFNISAPVAGVTFLALANGAPDITSIIVSVFSGSSDFGLGEPLSSGTLVTSIVFAFCALLAPSNIQLDISFIRDLGTYLIGVIFVGISVLSSGSVSTWQSVVCLLIYIVYIVLVVGGRYLYVFFRWVRKKVISRNEKKRRKQEEERAKLESITSSISLPSLVEVELLERNQQEHELMISYGFTSFNHSRDGPKSIRTWSPTTLLLNDEPSSFSLTTASVTAFEAYFVLGNAEDIPEIEMDKLDNILIRFMKWLGIFDLPWYQKLLFFFELPFIFIRNLTIPKADPSEWSKFFAVMNPIFTPMFLTLVIRYHFYLINGVFPLILVCGICGLPLSFFILISSKCKMPPKYHFIFIPFSFIFSVCWIYCAASELLSLLMSVGIIFQIPNIILAATVLSFGNSIGDMVANVTLAREGMGNASAGAIFSSPCLNLLIGFGIATLGYNALHGKPFPVDVTPSLILAYAFLLTSLIMSLIVVTLLKLKVPKLLGIYLILHYLAFMILSMLTDFNILWP